jgi:hypothetical protein
MKMLIAKMGLLTSMVLAALLSAQVAHAQRYQAAPRSYDAVEQSRDHRSTSEDQRIINEITRTDENAGK